MPDREGEQGSGAGQRQHVHRDARPGQHPGRLRRELRRPVPRVTAHHDADPPPRLPPAPSRRVPRSAPARPARCGREPSSQPATAAVAALTTARFIRFGPAATTPRSPAVPNSSRSREPVPQLAIASAAGPLRGPRPSFRAR